MLSRTSANVALPAVTMLCAVQGVTGMRVCMTRTSESSQLCVDQLNTLGLYEVRFTPGATAGPTCQASCRVLQPGRQQPDRKHLLVQFGPGCRAPEVWLSAVGHEQLTSEFREEYAALLAAANPCLLQAFGLGVVCCHLKQSGVCHFMLCFVLQKAGWGVYRK